MALQLKPELVANDQNFVKSILYVMYSRSGGVEMKCIEEFKAEAIAFLKANGTLNTSSAPINQAANYAAKMMPPDLDSRTGTDPMYNGSKPAGYGPGLQSAGGNYNPSPNMAGPGAYRDPRSAMADPRSAVPPSLSGMGMGGYSNPPPNYNQSPTSQGYDPRDPRGDPRGDPRSDPRGDPRSDPRSDPRGYPPAQQQMMDRRMPPPAAARGMPPLGPPDGPGGMDPGLLSRIEYEKSEPIIRLLAQVRKVGMDILFPQSVHDKILAAIYAAIKSAVTPAHRELIDMVMAVKESNSISQLETVSKTKVRGVLALLKHGEMLVTHGAEGEPVRLYLPYNIVTFRDLRERHDQFLNRYMVENHLFIPAILKCELTWQFDDETKALRLEAMDKLINKLNCFYMGYHGIPLKSQRSATGTGPAGSGGDDYDSFDAGFFAGRKIGGSNNGSEYSPSETSSNRSYAEDPRMGYVPSTAANNDLSVLTSADTSAPDPDWVSLGRKTAQAMSIIKKQAYEQRKAQFGMEKYNMYQPQNSYAAQQAALAYSSAARLPAAGNPNSEYYGNNSGANSARGPPSSGPYGGMGGRGGGGGPGNNMNYSAEGSFQPSSNSPGGSLNSAHRNALSANAPVFRPNGVSPSYPYPQGGGRAEYDYYQGGGGGSGSSNSGSRLPTAQGLPSNYPPSGPAGHNMPPGYSSRPAPPGGVYPPQPGYGGGGYGGGGSRGGERDPYAVNNTMPNTSRSSHSGSTRGGYEDEWGNNAPNHHHLQAAAGYGGSAAMTGPGGYDDYGRGGRSSGGDAVAFDHRSERSASGGAGIFDGIAKGLGDGYSASSMAGRDGRYPAGYENDPRYAAAGRGGGGAGRGMPPPSQYGGAARYPEAYPNSAAGFFDGLSGGGSGGGSNAGMMGSRSPASNSLQSKDLTSSAAATLAATAGSLTAVNDATRDSNNHFLYDTINNMTGEELEAPAPTEKLPFPVRSMGESADMNEGKYPGRLAMNNSIESIIDYSEENVAGDDIRLVPRRDGGIGTTVQQAALLIDPLEKELHQLSLEKEKMTPPAATMVLDDTVPSKNAAYEVNLPTAPAVASAPTSEAEPTATTTSEGM